MSDDATPAKVRLTDGLGPLPATEYSLFYEAPGDDDNEGWQEVVDAPGYTAKQMREYAGAQARTLAAQVLLRMADEAPISGNELARVRVLLAAASLRAMPIWTDAPADGSNPNPPECDPRA